MNVETRRSAALFALISATGGGFLQAQVSVVTQHNDLYRTGWNNRESLLNTSSVSNGTFGKLFSRTVDDQIYSQPLVVSGLSIGGGRRNVVFACTVNNSVYAFDADDSLHTLPLWQKSLTYDPDGQHAYRPFNRADVNCPNQESYQDFSGNIGIASTPVIDTLAGVIYVLARSAAGDGTRYMQYLHALDLATGNEKAGSPVEIKAIAPGTGTGSVNDSISFDPKIQNQRPALLLYNGVVYIEWAAHCDAGDYHGWVLGYDASTLKIKHVSNITANGEMGGIWMSGQAPAVDDAGNIYMSSGNGTTGTPGNANDTVNRGSSLLKFSVINGQFGIRDFFTPADYDFLNIYDMDYGVDGVMLIPGTHLSLSGSKEGYLYLIDNMAMGGTTTDNSNVLQLLNVNLSNPGRYKNIHGSPVYYRNDSGAEYVYAWGVGGRLRQFPFVRSQLRFDTLNQQTSSASLSYGIPGAMLSVSSSGGAAGSGIVWSSHPVSGNANHTTVPAMLQAFDANNISHELWNSNMTSGRDSVGGLSKFAPPTIANGKVYVASFSHQLQVYGLNPGKALQCTDSLRDPWKQADIGYNALPGNACQKENNFTVTATGSGLAGATDDMHFVYQQRTGNLDLSGRVDGLTGDSAAAAGLVVRSSLAPESPGVSIYLSGNHQLAFSFRKTASTAPVVNVHGPNLFQTWVRLSLDNNKVTGYQSVDGSNWVAIDSIDFNPGTSQYAGLVYSSGKQNLPGNASFSVVALTTQNAGPDESQLNFRGANVGNHAALLTWQLSPSIRLDQFVVEKSVKDSAYAAIGTVANDYGGNFRFTDALPADGTNYYRLKLVLPGGVVTYSAPVKVSFNFHEVFVFPNPVRSNEISFVNNTLFTYDKPVTVDLYAAGGTRILSRQLPVAGSSVVHVSLPAGCPKGVYFFSLQNAAGDKQVKKLIIAN